MPLKMQEALDDSTEACWSFEILVRKRISLCILIDFSDGARRAPLLRAGPVSKVKKGPYLRPLPRSNGRGLIEARTAQSNRATNFTVTTFDWTWID